MNNKTYVYAEVAILMISRIGRLSYRLLVRLSGNVGCQRLIVMLF